MGARIAAAGAVETQPGAKHGRQGRRAPVDADPPSSSAARSSSRFNQGSGWTPGESSTAIQSAASATSEAGSAAAASRRLRGSAGAIAGMMPGRAPGTAEDGA